MCTFANNASTLKCQMRSLCPDDTIYHYKIGKEFLENIVQWGDGPPIVKGRLSNLIIQAWDVSCNQVTW
jgi:hypothetical protein